MVRSGVPCIMWLYHSLVRRWLQNGCVVYSIIVLYISNIVCCIKYHCLVSEATTLGFSPLNSTSDAIAGSCAFYCAMTWNTCEIYFLILNCSWVSLCLKLKLIYLIIIYNILFLFLSMFQLNGNYLKFKFDWSCNFFHIYSNYILKKCNFPLNKVYPDDRISYSKSIFTHMLKISNSFNILVLLLLFFVYTSNDLFWR